MNTLRKKKKYIVLTKNGINKLIREQQLNHIDIQNILSSDINISFHEYLPEGKYEFENIDIYVDEEGNITIGGKTLTPTQINRL